MRLKELKPGEIFTIENKPTYPKLKIKGGYVDLRDEIVNRRGNCDGREVSLLTPLEIAEAFEDIEGLSLVEEWLEDAKRKWQHLM